MSEDADRTEAVIALFDRVASGYDHESLRLFPFAADRLLRHVPVAPGARVLDVATGTGAVAVAAAQMAAPGGRVTAIDLSEGMLARAEGKARALGLSNIDLHRMDAGALEFRSGYFDVVLCGFGLFFLADMERAVRGWVRVTRPGGRVAFSAFAPGSFEPLGARLFAALERAGVRAADAAPPAWRRLEETATCRALLERAGLEAVRVEEESIAYRLADASAWWDAVWNSGMRAYVEALDGPARERLRAAHLAEVQAEAPADGIRLQVNVRFVHGRKPDRGS